VHAAAGGGILEGVPFAVKAAEVDAQPTRGRALGRPTPHGQKLELDAADDQPFSMYSGQHVFKKKTQSHGKVANAILIHQVHSI
jgi:hypothetical protein